MKNLTGFSKSLIMTIVTFLASAISTGGFPSTGQGWEILGITVVGTALVYVAKNAVFPSVSVFGTINLKDLLSGLILAIGTGLSNWVATLVTGTPIVWHNLLILMGSVVIGYFAKNFGTQNPPANG
jgi:hypothetical protein